MSTAPEEGFVVFVRRDRSHTVPPESAERVAIYCPTYEDARRVRQRFLQKDRECVIRFLGQAGGGD
jgi:hypothetical protein